MNNVNKDSQKDRPTYKDTLNLLQTNFGMRANATLREPELQAFWREKNIDFELGLNNTGETFTSLLLLLLLLLPPPPSSSADFTAPIF